MECVQNALIASGVWEQGMTQLVKATMEFLDDGRRWKGRQSSTDLSVAGIFLKDYFYHIGVREILHDPIYLPKRTTLEQWLKEPSHQRSLVETCPHSSYEYPETPEHIAKLAKWPTCASHIMAAIDGKFLDDVIAVEEFPHWYVSRIWPIRS